MQLRGLRQRLRRTQGQTVSNGSKLISAANAVPTESGLEYAAHRRDK
jgi:hypothetical protein